MKNAQSILFKYRYKEIINELRPLMERHLRNEDVNLGIYGIKLISREDEQAKFLVITTQKTLWTFSYSFDNPMAWESLRLQNSARYIERQEMLSLENAYRDIQGNDEQELIENTMRFFLETATCLQREELARMKEAS